MRNLLVVMAVLGLMSANVYAGDSNRNAGETPAQEDTNRNPGETPTEPAPEESNCDTDTNGDGDSLWCNLRDGAHAVGRAAWEGAKHIPVYCEMDYEEKEVGLLVVGASVGRGKIYCHTPANPEPKESSFDKGEMLSISVGPQVGYYAHEGKIYFAGVGFGRDVDVFAMLTVNAAVVMGTSGFSVGAGVAGLAGVDEDGISANVAFVARIAEKVEGFYLGANVKLTAGAIWTPWTHGN